MIMKNIILLFLMLVSLQTFGQDVIYNFNTTTEGFTSSNSVVTLSSSNGAIVRDFGGYEAVLTPDLNLSEDDYEVIRIVVRNSSTFNNFKLFNLDNPGTDWNAATSVIVDIPPSTEFVTRDILIPKNTDNSGVIHQLALRAQGNPIGDIEIAQIVLIETGNWVANNNFETLTDGTLADWTASGGNVTAGFTTTDPQEGTQSGTLTFTGTGNKFLQSTTKDFGETVSPTNINTTLWVKSTTPGAIVSLVYSLKDATGVYLGQISTGNHTISSADTWELATFNKADLTNTFNQVLLKIKVVDGLDGTVISFDDLQPSVILYSTDNSWTGGKDTEWTDIANWTNGVAPTATKDSNVQVSANNPIISTTTGAAVKNLDVNASAALTITGGGSLIVSGTSTGNVTYNTTLGTENWYFVSSPVFGETYDNAYVAANSLAINGTNNAIGSYATADNTWSYMQTDASATFTPGTGYSVRRATSAGSGDISFTGTINTSDVAASVLTGGADSFNLIGNPFTAYLNSASFLTDNTGSLDTQTIWVWNQASGIYETKVTADGFVLAPTQGFFVNASSATNLNIAESYQANTGSVFQKTTNTEVKLIMNDGTNNRFAKLYYLDNATTGFDNGYDGKLFSGVAQPFAIYTHLVADSEGKKYQVQSLPNSDLESMVIPIGVNANAGKEITFLAEALNLPDGIKVFLEDRLANTFNELSDNKTFKVNLSEALNDVGRFYLHTSSNALSINDSVILENVSIYKTNASTLKLVGLPNGIANIKLINVLGKQLMNTSFNANGAKEISLPNLAAGIYIVQLETQSGKLNKKIVLE
jgi:hypothetical protein